MKNEQIIENLIEVEAMCEMLKQKAYSTRKKLERVYASTPKRANKKAVADIVNKYRLRIAKQTIK